MRSMPSWGSICWRCVLYGAVFIMAVVLPAAVMRYVDRDPIVRIEDMAAAGDVIVASGRINIRSHFDKLRYCDTDVGRFLYRLETHDGREERVIVPLTATNTALTGIGPDQQVVISLDVPPRLATGRWYYYSIAEDRCGVFSLMQVRRTPDIPLDLVSVD